MIGGFEVIPGTATDEVQKLLVNHLDRISGDFIRLPEKVQNLPCFKDKARLVKAKAGDLILFDSRLIHGGVVGPGYASAKDSPLTNEQFARFAFTVCMAPISKVADPLIL